MRAAFIQQLMDEARINSSVFLIVGDLGFSVVEPFAQEFPDRYLNAGVAEQNMTGIAAGLAKEGYTVFTYSIGNFPTLRCMEQIRYDICYHNLNVKIVAVGGGYAYGPLGASHHSTEEIGMLRSIPNLTICAPGDPIETKVITSLITKHTGPCYLRLGKAGEPIVHQKPLDFNIGDIVPVITGNETAVFSTGAMLKYSADYIIQNKLNWALYSFPVIKPFDPSRLLPLGTNFSTIITIEEHQRSAGFGSMILESFHDLMEEYPDFILPKIKRIAIPDTFTNISGSQTFLRQQMGLFF